MSRSLLILAMLLTTNATPVARAQSTVAVQYLFSAVNQERANHHLPLVRLDASLTQAAVAHAQLMADHGTITHRFPDEPELSVRANEAGARFNLISENVAEGATVVILQDAWMHSDEHRANILDPNVDAIGIAVVERNGVLYAVQDFQHTVQTLSLEQQEAAVGLLLDRAGVALLPDHNARQACAMDSGYVGQQPRFVMRYTTTDLTKLPSQLQARLAKAQDHHAAVGACAPAEKSDFAHYRIAILLYP